MAESVSKVCRICREHLDENEYFHFLNDNGSMLLSKLLDFLPEIDLDFVQNPICCNQCKVTIDRIHKFKSLCVQTENVLSSVKSEPEIKMIKEEVLENNCKNEYAISMAECVLKVCRICREQLGENEHFNFLNNDNGSTLLSKLLDFLPKIDLDFVQNPISCNRCTIILDEIHKFKKICVKTETVINDLKMQQKSFNNGINRLGTDSEIETIKEEFLKDKLKDEPPVCIEVAIKPLFYCYTCDFTTYNKRNLALHMKTHRLKVRQLKCVQCSHTTLNNSSSTELKQKSYKCDICDYSYTEKHTLKVHLRLHTGEKPYKCTECDYRFSRKWDLKTHIRTHTGEKPYKCDICNYSCSQKHNLTVHLRIHNGKKLYNCTECEYHCFRKSCLTTHMHTHTGEKPYKCDLCDYRSSRKSLLKRHTHTHTGEKPYKCDKCDYSCALKHTLKVHLNLHTGEKPYKCTKCNYHCNWKSHLITHIQTHTGEKPYKCDLCDYRSNRKSLIKKHFYTHTGEKPYKCDICDYSCTQKHPLKVHLKLHIGEKLYKCMQCDYRCNYKSNLKTHIRTCNV